MKYTLTVLLTLMAVVACGEKTNDPNNEQPAPIYISLEKKEVTLYYGENTTVQVSGTDAYCSVNVENEFIVWATGGNNSIEIDAQHVGTTQVIVSCDKAENKDTCFVTIKPTTDYIGSAATLWGKGKDEIKKHIDPSYSKGSTDTQRGCITFYYNYSGYDIACRYYYNEEGGLVGIHKSIEPSSDSETIAYINIATSMSQYMEVLSSPSTHRLFSHPDGYYASLYKPTKNNKLDVFYAPTLEDAQNHPFVKYL